MGLELAKAWVTVRGDTSRFAGDLNRARAGIISRISRLSGSINRILGTIGIAGAGFGFISIIRAGEQFNRKMRNSIAIMKDVDEAFRKNLRQSAIETAKTVQFSATEIADSYFFLASAGLKSNQIIAAMPQTTQFAQAGMFDLSTAVQLATDAQAVMQLRSDDAAQNLINLTRVTDVLVKANTLADANTRQFAVAMTTKAGAAARSAGIEIEELGAILAAFAERGTKGSDAGTALNIVLRDLQSKSITNRKEFEKFGGSAFVDGNLRPIADILEDIETGLSKLNDEGKKAKLMQLGFQDRSVVFIQTLLGASKQIRTFEKDLKKAGGTTKKVAEQQLTPFQKGMAQLGAMFTDIGARISDFIGPILQKLGTAFGKAWDQIKIVFEAMGPTVDRVSGEIVDKVANFVLESSKWIRVLGTKTKTVWKLVEVSALFALSTIEDHWKNIFITLPAIATPVLIALTEGIFKYVEFFIGGIERAGKAFKIVNEKLLPAIMTITVETMKPIVDELFDHMSDRLADMVKEFGEQGKRAALALATAVTGGPIGEIIAEAITGQRKGDRIVGDKEKRDQAIEDVGTSLKELTTLAKEQFESRFAIFETILTTFEEEFEGIPDVASEKTNKLRRTMERLVDDLEWARKLLDIKIAGIVKAPDLAKGEGGPGEGLIGAPITSEKSKIERIAFENLGKRIQEQLIEEEDPLVKQGKAQIKIGERLITVTEEQKRTIEKGIPLLGALL